MTRHLSVVHMHSKILMYILVQLCKWLCSKACSQSASFQPFKLIVCVCVCVIALGSFLRHFRFISCAIFLYLCTRVFAPCCHVPAKAFHCPDYIEFSPFCFCCCCWLRLQLLCVQHLSPSPAIVFARFCNCFCQSVYCK